MFHGTGVIVQLFGCGKNEIKCSFFTMDSEKERKKGRLNEQKRRKKPERREEEKKK
jgi:hypothetical protein